MSQPRDIEQVLGDLLSRSRPGGPVTDREIDELAAAHPHLDEAFRKLRLIVQAAQRAEQSPPPSPTPLDRADAVGLSLGPPDIPDYELLRLISRGGFGQVWLARNRYTRRFHAVKLVLRSQEVELAGVRACQQRLPAHPHLVPIEHVGDTGQFLYCTMPLADNANGAAVEDPQTYEPLTLQRHGRRRGPLPAAEVLALAGGLAGALEHLHAAGLLHRDVKPANVLRVGGSWVLGDLGLVSDVERTAGESGTRAFWPPEGQRDQTADLYALGKTLFLLWTGAGLERFAELRRGTLPHTRLDRPARTLRRILLRACHDDPAARYPTARALLDDLERARSPGTRWRWLGLVAAAMLLTGVVLVALPFFRTRGAATSPPASVVSVELTVLVEVIEGSGSTWRSIREPGVLPVRRGNRVRVHALLREPAHIHLLWFDSRGQVFPLYPWNEDRIVRTLADPAPARAPQAEVHSPMSDTKGWLIDEHAGLETVLLLARRSSQPEPVAWTELIGRFEPTRLGHSLETGVRGFDPGQPFDALHDGQHRGIESEARERDQDLLALLERLRPHFDTVRAVRFAHEEAKSPE